MHRMIPFVSHFEWEKYGFLKIVAQKFPQNSSSLFISFVVPEMLILLTNMFDMFPCPTRTIFSPHTIISLWVKL
eukprot:NODE_1514_length_440_cov_0.715655_g1504_i0.p1 GENE.NODE_1514_length_440_cov_0.715655_g1504_i0~~NODE_1514_length_440_cov_0.715655_g1504_i0.p1  ORF type:complete len:74 (+),score=9.67 NODE_1514_length_440_cov_0.715655_g1504_i0:182-403(+)